MKIKLAKRLSQTRSVDMVDVAIKRVDKSIPDTLSLGQVWLSLYWGLNNNAQKTNELLLMLFHPSGLVKMSGRIPIFDSKPIYSDINSMGAGNAVSNFLPLVDADRALIVENIRSICGTSSYRIAGSDIREPAWLNCELPLRDWGSLTDKSESHSMTQTKYTHIQIHRRDCVQAMRTLNYSQGFWLNSDFPLSRNCVLRYCFAADQWEYLDDVTTIQKRVSRKASMRSTQGRWEPWIRQEVKREVKKGSRGWGLTLKSLNLLRSFPQRNRENLIGSCKKEF